MTKVKPVATKKQLEVLKVMRDMRKKGMAHTFIPTWEIANALGGSTALARSRLQLLSHKFMIQGTWRYGTDRNGEHVGYYQAWKITKYGVRELENQA